MRRSSALSVRHTLGDTKLGEPHLEVLIIPSNARLGVGRLLHAVDEAQIVEPYNYKIILLLQ